MIDLFPWASDMSEPTAANFLPGEPTNARLALELITHPSLPYAPEVDDAPDFDVLVEQSAVCLVGLARAAQNHTIQQRIMEDVGMLTLEVSCRRLQRASAAIVRRLLIALAMLHGQSGTSFDQVVGAADEAIVSASASPLRPSEVLPDQVAAAIVGVLSLDHLQRKTASDLLVQGAGRALALFVLAGVPFTPRP